MKKILIPIIGLLFCGHAAATTWKVDALLQGNDGGFRFSALHSASLPNPMINTGNPMPSINSASGVYDDVSNLLLVDLQLSNGDILSLNGLLDFAIDGKLSVDSGISYSGLDNLAASNSSINATGSIGFGAGEVCCHGNNRPNSFRLAPGGSLHYLTLWGANYGGIASAFQGYDQDTSFGIDLRLGMSAVPVPAAVYLFGTAILGLIGFQRRKSAA